jgi:hypothetical protein
MVSPLIKEPQYWSQNYELGVDWYASLFPKLPEGNALFTGEGSVSYLHHPLAPSRLLERLPQVKLIVLLREPVSRAYSEYWMHRRVGRTQESFEDAVLKELKDAPECPLEFPEPGEARLAQGYLTRSAALPFLKRWLEHFPPQQLLVLKNEEMSRDLPGTLRRVCDYLEIARFAPANPKRLNEGRYAPISDELQGRLNAWFAPHQKALEDFLVGHSRSK